MKSSLEELIIYLTEEMKRKGTSSDEVKALTELVKVVNQIPRAIEIFD